jgi:hypothetical protein
LPLSPFFEEFRAKGWALLWRGSRVSVCSQESHHRYDSRPNTVMLIQDKDGNLLGGFTPVEWDSKSDAKGDNSLRRFLFTLRNLCGVVQGKKLLNARLQSIRKGYR